MLSALPSPVPSSGPELLNSLSSPPSPDDSPVKVMLGHEAYGEVDLDKVHALAGVVPAPGLVPPPPGLSLPTNMVAVRLPPGLTAPPGLPAPPGLATPPGLSAVPGGDIGAPRWPAPLLPPSLSGLGGRAQNASTTKDRVQTPCDLDHSAPWVVASQVPEDKLAGLSSLPLSLSQRVLCLSNHV